MDNKLKEKFKENLEIALGGGSSIIGGLMSDAIIGQLLPSVATTYLSYKQKKTEKNLMHAIEQLKKSFTKIEEDLKKLDDVEFIKEKLLPIALDYISDEQQEEKIKYFVEGIKTTAESKLTDEDLILAYYDILHELRIADIRMIRHFYERSFADVYAYITKKDKSEKLDKFEAVEDYIINKLYNLNLVKISKTWGDLTGKEAKISPSSISISTLGTNIVEFFKIQGESKEVEHG